MLLKAAASNAEQITPDVLQQGLEYADQKLRRQTGLTSEDRQVLELVIEKGTFSDANITLADLERVGAKEFSEILQILKKLIQLDLVQQVPASHTDEFAPTPMLLSNKF